MAGVQGTHVHTADGAVPPLDDDLAGVLDDLAGIHPGIDLIRDGIRLLALSGHSLDKTQTLLATIAGSDGFDVLTALSLLVQRLTNPTANPCLRALPLQVQKDVQHLGEQHVYETAEFASREPVAEAAARIDGI